MSEFDKGYLLGMGEAMVSKKKEAERKQVKEGGVMNKFKNYGCPKGAPGAMGVDYAQLEKTISFAMRQFMAKREEILLGGKPEPPEVTGYKVYIYYNGGAAEFWLWRENQWVNWSYMEQ